MDILNLLLKRTTIGFGSNMNDEWIEEVVSLDDDEFGIILTDNELNRYHRDANIIALREKYKLKAMFDLKNPLNKTNVNLFLYIFTKEKITDIKYGIYKNQIKKKKVRADSMDLCEEYPEQYFSYLDDINNYVNNNIQPLDSDFQEFGEIDEEIRDENVWNPNRYNKQALAVKEQIAKEKLISLADVADIYLPRPNDERKHTQYTINSLNFKYPLVYGELSEGILTNLPLKKGDIVISMNQKKYLICDEPQYEIHTSPNNWVIRPRKISPEYLFLYLESDTAKIIVDSLCGSAFGRIRRDDLNSFPIIESKKTEINYVSIFKSRYFLQKNIQAINTAIFELEIKNKSKDNELELLLNKEFIEKLKINKPDIIKEFLEKDINELKICFKHRAYKATLILAGSILEAVLIDWLGEIHKKDYFTNEYRVKDRYYPTKEKRADLIDYIDAIKEINRPNWVNEANKAHIIRQKRNLVHAKLCLQDDTINQDTCKEVIKYLLEVLETRCGKMVKTK